MEENGFDKISKCLDIIKEALESGYVIDLFFEDGSCMTLDKKIKISAISKMEG